MTVRGWPTASNRRNLTPMGRRPVIQDLRCCTWQSRGWPVSAGHDGRNRPCLNWSGYLASGPNLSRNHIGTGVPNRHGQPPWAGSTAADHDGKSVNPSLTPTQINHSISGTCDFRADRVALHSCCGAVRRCISGPLLAPYRSPARGRSRATLAPRRWPCGHAGCVRRAGGRWR